MVRLTDSPDMTLDVYRGRKTTTQQHIRSKISFSPKVISLSQVFPNSHFGSFYPPILVPDPQKLGPERCIFDQSKIIFIYLLISILMYFGLKKRQELSIFWQ